MYVKFKVSEFNFKSSGWECIHYHYDANPSSSSSSSLSDDPTPKNNHLFYPCFHP